MAREVLEQLRNDLLSMPAEVISAPNLPMAVAIQEANDLLTHISSPPIGDKLLSVGLPPTHADSLARAVRAAKEAQSEWVLVRDRTKSERQREREQAAHRLRLDLLAAARWNLRGDRVALGTLSAIAQGEGVADLAQDLNDLAVLLEQRASRFDPDHSFDVQRAVADARAHARELSAGTSEERLQTEQATAKDLRDRAFSYLDQLVDEIREAGRYAFRRDPQALKPFHSRYLKRRRSRTRDTAVEEEVPVLEEGATV